LEEVGIILNAGSANEIDCPVFMLVGVLAFWELSNKNAILNWLHCSNWKVPYGYNAIIHG